jgi:hypothetical protein
VQILKTEVASRRGQEVELDGREAKVFAELSALPGAGGYLVGGEMVSVVADSFGGAGSGSHSVGARNAGKKQMTRIVMERGECDLDDYLER